MRISFESWRGYYGAYFLGEAKGAELIRRLADFTPGPAELRWIKTWAEEEEKHHRLWGELVAKKGTEVKRDLGTLSGVYAITEGFVDGKNWTGAMVGAGIIEHVSSCAAHYLYPHADSDTRRVFDVILNDDIGHIAFDLAQIRKIASAPQGAKSVVEVHKKFLAEVLEWPLRKGLLDGELAILNNAYTLHRNSLAEFGVMLPEIVFENTLGYRIKKRVMEALSRVI